MDMELATIVVTMEMGMVTMEMDTVIMGEDATGTATVIIP